MVSANHVRIKPETHMRILSYV